MCIAFQKAKIKYLVPREFMQPTFFAMWIHRFSFDLKVKLHEFEIRIWMGDREYTLCVLSMIRN